MLNKDKKSKTLPLVVYTSSSRINSPISLAREMGKDLLASRELAWRLTARDISARYRQSILGVMWLFFPPIVTALVFVFLNSRQIINLGETRIPYPAFAIFGTIVWQIFVDSLNTPLRMVTSSISILSKINFSKEALILSGLGQIFFGGGIRLLILLVVFVVYKIPLTPGSLLSIPAIFMLVMLGTSLGLLITPIGLLYTDISHSLVLVTGLWFLITPVVYPTPTSFPFSLLAVLNPVCPLLTGARDLATEGVLHNPVPFFLITGLTFMVFLISWVVFRLTLPILVERM